MTPDPCVRYLAAAVTAGRAGIDAVDAELVRLVGRRVAISREIQAARRAAGGGTLEPGREEVVVRRYADALGEHGADLARAVLLVCRGAVD